MKVDLYLNLFKISTGFTFDSFVDKYTQRKYYGLFRLSPLCYLLALMLSSRSLGFSLLILPLNFDTREGELTNYRFVQATVSFLAKVAMYAFLSY